MEIRTCNTCNLDKPLTDEFYRKSVFLRKDGAQGISFMKKCLVCHNTWQMKNYFDSKLLKEDDGYNLCRYCGNKYLHNDFETAFMCIFCFKNKKSKQDRVWRETHKTEKIALDKKYQIENKDKISKNKKEYYLKNREQFIKRNIRNEKRRRATDPIFKLRKNISSYIRGALKQNKKGKSFVKRLTYSLKELKEHLEKLFEFWMTWENYGIYRADIWNDNDPTTWTWQIDHIIPHSKFKYTSMEDQEFKDCWALRNLRPYSAKQNLIKGNKNERN